MKFVLLLLRLLMMLVRLLKMEKNLNLSYFSEKELNHLTPSCSLSDMSPSFMQRLDLARRCAGIPFVLNCAYRSKEWDISKGRSGTSMHCKGRAVDIRCTNSVSRFKIIYSLLNCGFTSIGIYETFIHVDDREVEPGMSMIWIGDGLSDIFPSAVVPEL